MEVVVRCNRTGYLVAIVLCLGLASRAQAQGTLQCSATCESVESGYYCAAGYLACDFWYASYVPNSSSNVSISEYTCCMDPSNQPVMVPSCGPANAEQNAECPPPERPCEDYCPCQCMTWGCDWACSYSPILIDLDNKGYQLTGLRDPVRFDLNGDGKLETVGWTARRTNQGFLWLDRNGNGRVDSGAELFGNFTSLADGQPALNGFRALAEFDLPVLGGNGDGVISAEDEVYRRLRIWVDKNHNGVSEPDEILTLPQAGVVRIELRYALSPRMDEFGNSFKFRGQAWIKLGGKEHAVPIYDVFFVHQE